MSVFCHQCQSVTSSNSSDDGPVCGLCGSDFLEALDESNRSEFSNNTPRNMHRDMMQFMAMLHNISGSTAAGQSSSGSGSNSSSPRVTRRATRSQTATAEMNASRPLPVGVAVSGGGSDSPFSYFGPPGVQIRFHSQGASGGNDDTMEHHTVHIQQLLQNLVGAVGNINDYVFDVDNFDNIITQLMNQLDGGGPPPATDTELKQVNKVQITEEQAADGLQCFVCFDEFETGTETDQLPCKHHFHHDCIVPWLQMHGTCPVCRKTLRGEDTSTQNFVPDLPTQSPNGPANSNSETEAQPNRRRRTRNNNPQESGVSNNTTQHDLQEEDCD